MDLLPTLPLAPAFVSDAKLDTEVARVERAERADLGGNRLRRDGRGGRAKLE